MIFNRPNRKLNLVNKFQDLAFAMDNVFWEFNSGTQDKLQMYGFLNKKITNLVEYVSMKLN